MDKNKPAINYPRKKPIPASVFFSVPLRAPNGRLYEPENVFLLDGVAMKINREGQYSFICYSDELTITKGAKQ